MVEAVQNNLPAGFKKTKQRKCVLAVLEQASRPLSAPEIYSRIREEGHMICLSTIFMYWATIRRYTDIASIAIQDDSRCSL